MYSFIYKKYNTEINFFFEGKQNITKDMYIHSDIIILKLYETYI